MGPDYINYKVRGGETTIKHVLVRGFIEPVTAQNSQAPACWYSIC